MMGFTINGNQMQMSQNGKQTSFIESQILLLKSRKKWGVMYSLATVTGLFFIPGVLSAMMSETDLLRIFQKVIPLPAISFLITIGMYVLNDLVDSELDRANGKKRPIPSGLVSKRQAWIFVISTNAIALFLAIITFEPFSILIVTLMIIIGIMYSAPKIALMARFVVKTLTIAIYYALCALLSITSIYGLHLAADNPIVLVQTLTVLSIMIFISSTLNDLGDVDGDRAAGRRTIPIVIGKDNTLKLAMVLAFCMLTVTWALFALSIVIGHQSSIVTASLTSISALFVASKMSNMRKGLNDMESMRKHHKKLFPLNIILQSDLMAGGLIAL